MKTEEEEEEEEEEDEWVLQIWPLQRPDLNT